MSDEELASKDHRARGGKARARALSPQRRREIAMKAANSRWNADLPQATHEGQLKLGSKAVQAAVLPNGKRLLTQGTFLKALGRSRTPKGGTGALSTVDGLPSFLAADRLRPFVSNELRESTTPIFYRSAGGKKSVGYDAELLPMVCEVYLRLRDESLAGDGSPPKQWSHIIKACDILMRGMARVGIVALVDEATGYQEVRDRQALQVILDKYLTDEWAKWTKTFPDEFYKELFRLKKLPYPSLGNKRPQYVGHWTNNIVYSRLAPGVKTALQKKNPRRRSGDRARKHHQFLTRDFGHPELRDHLQKVIFLMKACATWEDFEPMLDRAATKYGDTMPLRLEAPGEA